ncbi:MAG TPA: cytochrome c3 family protein [Fimbriiglobus sp.]|nr:cytochrome c3 family protein [Fimbriiglobus sp.]
MPQLFPKGMNVISRLVVLGLPVLGGAGAVAGAAFYRSDYSTGTREIVEQPVPFSHKHHVSELGIGCQYCHTSAEVSASAGFPPTRTCMNCHQQIWVSAELLQPVRDSFVSSASNAVGKPIPWTKVHNVPHYVYFNHSIHLAKGVGCYSCHGRVDQMSLLFQTKSLLMEWCLDCHREPEKHLRPKAEVYNLAWQPADYRDPTTGKQEDRETGQPYTQLNLGKKLKEEYQVRDQSVLTNCSICHR